MPIFGLYPLQVTVNLESTSPHLLVHYLPSPPHAKKSPMPSTPVVHVGEGGWKWNVPSPLHGSPHQAASGPSLHVKGPKARTNSAFHYCRTNTFLGCSFFISHSSGKHSLKNSCYLPGYPQAELSKIWEWKPRKTGHFCAFTAQAEGNKTSN